MYYWGVCLVKATNKCWINQKIRAMDHVVEKLGLYNQHLQKVDITNLAYLPNFCKITVANAKARATLEGRYAKLVDPKILLPWLLFIDVLAEEKNFSMKTQEIDISIIDVI